MMPNTLHKEEGKKRQEGKLNFPQYFRFLKKLQRKPALKLPLTKGKYLAALFKSYIFVISLF
jgi:hypothetical protein